MKSKERKWEKNRKMETRKGKIKDYLNWSYKNC